jgi:hypothetical protein
VLPKRFTFQAKVWLYPGEGASWHFATLPVEIADEITFLFGELKRGWGSLPVLVTVGATSWKTSIFPDKKSSSYLLPLKADVRKKEKFHAGDEVTFAVEVVS